MGFQATGSAVRKSAVLIALATLAACTTHVPLAKDYRRPDIWPTDVPNLYEEHETTPLEVAGDVEARTRAHFVVRQLSLPSAADTNSPI